MDKLLELITRELPFANIFVREVSVEVMYGVARFISTGEEIPIAHLARQTSVLDGLYVTSEATCNGACSIGKPSPKCVAAGSYSKQKCSVIYLEPPNEISLEVYRLSKDSATKQGE